MVGRPAPPEDLPPPHFQTCDMVTLVKGVQSEIFGSALHAMGDFHYLSSSGSKCWLYCYPIQWFCLTINLFFTFESLFL